MQFVAWGMVGGRCRARGKLCGLGLGAVSSRVQLCCIAPVQARALDGNQLAVKRDYLTFGDAKIDITGFVLGTRDFFEHDSLYGGEGL